MMDPREVNNLIKLHNFTTDVSDQTLETSDVVSNETSSNNDFEQVKPQKYYSNDDDTNYTTKKNNYNNKTNNYNKNINKNNNNNNQRFNNKYFKQSTNYDEIQKENLNKTNDELNKKENNNQNENIKLKSLGDPLDVDVVDQDYSSDDDDEHRNSSTTGNNNNNNNRYKKSKSYGYKN